MGHLESQKSIKLSTYAVLFFGTPHQGGNGVSLVEILTSILSTVTHTNQKLLAKTKLHSEWLQNQQSDFNAISQDFETVFFYETLEMPLPVGRLLVRTYLLIHKFTRAGIS